MDTGALVALLFLATGSPAGALRFLLAVAFVTAGLETVTAGLEIATAAGAGLSCIRILALLLVAAMVCLVVEGSLES